MGVWIIDAEPVFPDDNFYISFDVVLDLDWYIQSEPVEQYTGNDHFYIEHDLFLDTNWYLQADTGASPDLDFYVQGEPFDSDMFYIQQNEQPDLFYFVDLFSPNESELFYFVIDENYEPSGFVIISEFDPGYDDWRMPNDPTADPQSQLVFSTDALEDLDINVELIDLSPEEVQQDLKEWNITFEDY